MQDVIRACKQRQDFGAKQAVSVGEDADSHSDCSENTEYAREIFGPEDLVLVLASFCDDDTAQQTLLLQTANYDCLGEAGVGNEAEDIHFTPSHVTSITISEPILF